MPKTSKPPAYRLFKPRNLAAVTIGGKVHYLGEYGSPESHEMYARLIAGWQKARQNGNPISPAATTTATVTEEAASLTVNELILRYLQFAQTYYRKNGQVTGEYDNIRCSLRPLKKLFGTQEVAPFGPKDLELVRQEMIDAGLARTNINNRVSRIKRTFRWASREGLIPASTYYGLTAVVGLKRHRSAARESKPVTTVPDEIVAATVKVVNLHIGAMIQVEELTGMRPQDVRNIRTHDIDMTGDVWVYTPWTHKTEHHGHTRQIAIGPRAQAVLRPFLKPQLPEAFLFSPRAAVEAIRIERAKRRKTKRTPSEERRGRKERPKRQPSDEYSKGAYERAIARGCERAEVPHWFPNQLRHNCGTKVRRLFGLDAAAAVLGHHLGTVTEVYAEAELKKALEVMRQIG